VLSESRMALGDAGPCGLHGFQCQPAAPRYLMPLHHALATPGLLALDFEPAQRFFGRTRGGPLAPAYPRQCLLHLGLRLLVAGGGRSVSGCRLPEGAPQALAILAHLKELADGRIWVHQLLHWFQHELLV